MCACLSVFVSLRGHSVCIAHFSVDPLSIQTVSIDYYRPSCCYSACNGIHDSHPVRLHLQKTLEELRKEGQGKRERKGRGSVEGRAGEA